MNFKDLDRMHKRHLLLNSKVSSFLLRILADLLDESDYVNICTSIADINADILALNDYEVDQLIADIQNKIEQNEVVARVQVRKNRN